MSKYPHDWQTTTLGEICTAGGLQTGPFGSQLHASDYTETGIPVVMPKDIVSYRVSTSDIARIPAEMAASLSRHRLLMGDIVFGRRGDIGRCALITASEQGWLCGTGCLRARINQTVVASEFLIFYLDLAESKVWLETNAVGQTMLNLNTTILAELPVLLPPLSEQRQITAILSAWDEAIVLTKQLIAALQQRKQALVQLLLSGEMRFGEFSEWESVALGELVTPVSRSQTIEPDKEYSLIGVRWYLAGAHIHEVRLGSEILTNVLSRIQKDDILYNKMWVTKAAFGVAKAEHDGAYGTSEYPQFRAVPNKLDVNYIEYAFHDSQFQHEATSLCRGTTGRARLNPSDFLKIKISLPQIQEQSRIADMLRSADTEINIYVEYLQNLKQLKRGLMQQLLTGQVRISQLED